MHPERERTVAIDASEEALAAELRAEVARQLIPVYVLASRVGLHPAHLGQVLRGRRPLPPELADRHKRVYAEAIARARARGWDAELDDND